MAVLAAVPALAAPPAEVPVPASMTPAERDANALWSMRAALNVAALQCQFSPFLATVSNYNAILSQHDGELRSAFNSVQGHFKRVGKAQGLKLFDQFTTRTYNSYSTLDGQRSFCETAAAIGRDALRQPRGKLTSFSVDAVPKLRQSLAGSPQVGIAVDRSYIRLPDIATCYDKNGKLKRGC